MLYVFVCLATVINVAVLVVNLSSSSVASVAGMDRSVLLNDSDFVQAVQAVVQSCRINADTETIKC
jgi:hypothetical protein